MRDMTLGLGFRVSQDGGPKGHKGIQRGIWDNRGFHEGTPKL